MSTTMELSKQALMDAVHSILTKSSAGMLNGTIKSVKALNMAGVAFEFDKIRVEVAPLERPKPQPKERKTATGFPVRLASVNGERVA